MSTASIFGILFGIALSACIGLIFRQRSRDENHDQVLIDLRQEKDKQLQHNHHEIEDLKKTSRSIQEKLKGTEATLKAESALSEGLEKEVRQLTTDKERIKQMAINNDKENVYRKDAIDVIVCEDKAKHSRLIEQGKVSPTSVYFGGSGYKKKLDKKVVRSYFVIYDVYQEAAQKKLEEYLAEKVEAYMNLRGL